jgi:hypothetical protein
MPARAQRLRAGLPCGLVNFVDIGPLLLARKTNPRTAKSDERAE